MSKALPCPFCGTNRIKISKPHITYPCEPYYHAYCDECFARGPAGESETEAIRHWNMRRGNPPLEHAEWRKPNDLCPMTYEELLAAALETDTFEAKKALARWLDDHHEGWNGEDYDISDIGAPSGSRTMRPVYGEEDEDGNYPILDYKIM